MRSSILISLLKSFFYLFPLLILSFLWIPSLFATYAPSEVGRLRFFEAAALGAIFWILLFAVVSRLWILLIIMIPVALVWPLELWVRISNEAPITHHVIALVWESNWAEGSNFLSAYGFGLLFLSASWLFLYAIGIWLARRSGLRWTHRSRFWCIAIFSPLLVLLTVVNERLDAVGDEFLLQAMDDSGVSAWGSQWTDVFPVNLLVSVQHFRQQQQKLLAVRRSMEGRSLNAQQTTSKESPEIVVLVIGESASATRWGLLGYSRDTTPRLSQISGLTVFSDVVALSTATRTAVPGVLSRRPVLWPDGRVDLNAEPSLIQAFSEVGYQTHWISNQSPLGQHDTSISVYAQDAADVRFLNPGTYASRSSHDEVLLAPLRAILLQPGRHLVVLHLLGSHFDYSLRYPENFDHFKPSLQSVKTVQTDSANYEDQVDNSYDNSLRYTDHVLAEVLEIIQYRGGNAMAAYFSDHGVDPVQGLCSSKSAGRRSEAAYRVPAFFWLSEKMRIERKTQWQRLQENSHKPYTTRAVYSSILELAGIDVVGGLPRENFLQDSYGKSMPRIIASTSGGRLIDFDAALRKNSCFIAAD